ncbi:uncharacterized protein LOC130692777, partial [Daphnia carinata]|uniref:uncharacterized protein LOC130692777 n=1 Tax=Daphnia carinata TaxID=120202 RepID=UPI002579BAF1
MTAWKKIAFELEKTIQARDQDQTEVNWALLKNKWEQVIEVNRQLKSEDGSDDYLNEENYDEVNDEMIELEIRSNRIMRPTPLPAVLPQESIPLQTRKLTALELKKFNGDIQQWRPWWEAFRVSIHENSSLKDVERFAYLEKYLEGTAARIIAGLPITGTNYSRAIQLLERRYGQNHLIAQSHIKSLFNLPNVEKLEHTRNLTTLVDSALVHIRALEDLNISLDQYSIMIKTILLERIPNELQIMWNRQPNHRDADVATFIDFIQQELIARENIYQPTRNKPTVNHQNNNNPTNKQQHLGTTTQLTINDGSSRRGIKSKIPFLCKISHDKEPCNKTLQEKREIVTKERRCYHCLAKTHAKCDRRCPHCNNNHHITLCPSKNTIAPTTLTSLIHLPTHEGKRSILMIATVWVEGPRGTKKVALLYDSGAQRSFVSNRLATELNLATNGVETHQFQSFGNQVEPTKSVYRFNLNVRSSQPGAEAIQLSLLGTDTICMTPPYHASEFARTIKQSGKWLADERILPNRKIPNEIDVLIGTDYYRSIVLNEVITSNIGLTAVNTVFGWALHGTLPASNPTEVLSVTTLLVNQHDASTASADIQNPAVSDQLFNNENQPDESFDLRAFWTLEACGIQPTDETKNPFVDKYELGINRASDGRYIAPLPWNDKVNELQDNRFIAQKSLDGLLKRLRTKPNLLKAYDNQIKEYIQLGFVKEANLNFNGIFTYLPHHPVVRNDKTTTKVRPVFNGASKPKTGISVNDCLEPGPNLNPELLAVLLRFRTFKHAWISDIEKAFLQIQLTQTDSEALRFLWVKDPEDLNSAVVELTWARLPFGLTSSPFVLRMVILTHIKKYEDIYPEAVQLIRDQLYVDDQLGGASTIPAAQVLINQTIKIFADAKLDMKKWIATQEELLQPIQSKEQSNPTDGLIGSILTSSQSARVLGLGWDSTKDEFYYDASKLQTQIIGLTGTVTKRKFISISSQLFDPMGALGPFNLIAKILYKRIWEANIEWDQPIPNEVYYQWKKALDSLSELKHFRISRKILFSSPGVINIHVFCDASVEAYGAVVYIRGKSTTNEVSISQLCCKTRVAPSGKEMSLARKELMAALLGAQLSDYIKKTFHSITTIFQFWSDSRITLAWIKGDPQRWKPFVRNRIITINQLTKNSNWAHCPGQDNPADLASRGATIDVLNKDFWLRGPSWLQKEENHWPHHPTTQFDVSIFKEELSLEGKKTIVATRNLGQPEPFPFSRFSSLAKLIRVRAWMNRFGKLRADIPNSSITPVQITKSKTIMVPSLVAAETALSQLQIIQLIQRLKFKTEYELLSKGKPLPRSHNWTPLRPIWDHQEKVIRVTGRIEHHFLDSNARAPIILPKDHHITDLIIKEAHVKVGHQ